MGFGSSLLAEVERNVNQEKWGGTALTGRDITGDIAKLVNLDIALTALRDAIIGSGSKTITDLHGDLYNATDTKSAYDQLKTIATQLDITLSSLRDTLDSRLYNSTDAKSVYDNTKSILAQLDITLSALRDALRGTGNKTLTDLYNKAYDSTNDRTKIKIEDSSIMVPTEIQNSLIAYNSTLDRFLVKPDNPSNLDTTLSSRASEATVLELKNYTESLIPPVTISSGYIFIVPSGETKYVASYLYADAGDIYLDGDIFII